MAERNEAKVIRANAFELVDRVGRVRARLSMEHNSDMETMGPALTLYNENEDERAVLRLDVEDAVVNFGEGNTRMVLGTCWGDPFIEFLDEDAMRSFGVEMAGDGTLTFTAEDADGKRELWRLPAGKQWGATRKEA